jgi:hypothetical protein
MKHIESFDNFSINENLKSDIKRYIKQNREDLNDLADEDMWDEIYKKIYTDFDVDPESRKAEDLKQAFEFIF